MNRGMVRAVQVCRFAALVEYVRCRMTGITKDCHQGLMAESDRGIAVEEGELWVEFIITYVEWCTLMEVKVKREE